MSLVRNLIFSLFSSKTNSASRRDDKILFISNALIPTLQLSFLKPLEGKGKSKIIRYDVFTEQDLKDKFGKQLREEQAKCFFLEKIAQCNPSVVIFCRYSGPHSTEVLSYCKEHNIPTIFHIDDDLLNVPLEIGQKKFEYHNHPLRLSAVKSLLTGADLIYCSNSCLRERLENLGIENNFYVGKIYSAGKIYNSPKARPARKMGYMGFDHAYDFEIAAGAISEILDKYPAITFEIFGSIPIPPVLKRHGARVKKIDPVPNYVEFMKKFASLEWDIAISPLADTKFNQVKSNTKWVEYTSVGAAVAASKGTIYDECCAEECGLLLNDNEWFSGLSYLIDNNEARTTMIHQAQGKLSLLYTDNQLRFQVQHAIELATLYQRKDSMSNMESI